MADKRIEAAKAAVEAARRQETQAAARLTEAENRLANLDARIELQMAALTRDLDAAAAADTTPVLSLRIEREALERLAARRVGEREAATARVAAALSRLTELDEARRRELQAEEAEALRVQLARGEGDAAAITSRLRQIDSLGEIEWLIFETGRLAAERADLEARKPKIKVSMDMVYTTRNAAADQMRQVVAMEAEAVKIGGRHHQLQEKLASALESFRYPPAAGPGLQASVARVRGCAVELFTERLDAAMRHARDVRDRPEEGAARWRVEAAARAIAHARAGLGAEAQAK